MIFEVVEAEYLKLRGRGKLKRNRVGLVCLNGLEYGREGAKRTIGASSNVIAHLESLRADDKNEERPNDTGTDK